MKRLAKFILFAGLALIVLLGLLWVLGPYEDAELSAEFDAGRLDGGVSAYLAGQEARFDDITPGVEKQVIWAGAAEAKTPVSVLYVHGFSATAQEIRPVPDRVAAGLGANLVLMRLQGHGRGGEAMGTASVAGWMADMAEGLAVARRISDRVLILSTSTGGTLVAAAMTDPDLAQDVLGAVMVSPNFGINNSMAPLLTLPAARTWLPSVAGDRRSFEPRNPEQGTYWTTEYPSVAVLPMAALVKAVNALDLGRAKVPAMFWFSDGDRVVQAEKTRAAAAQWGGAVKIVNPDLGADDDPYKHVVAGDILSPGQNDAMVAGILEWAGGL